MSPRGLARGHCAPSRSMLHLWIIQLLVTGACLALDNPNDDDQTMDVLETENVLLECRVPTAMLRQEPRPHMYWIRSNRDGHDSVAISEAALENNYSIEFEPSNGRYDLRIFNATYNRDNGRFECRIKARNGGEILYEKSLDLTVLLGPSAPIITPSEPLATEGRQLNLTCSSAGGSPSPQIYWYREGHAQLLEAKLTKGRNKDEPTRSVLSISPTKEIDGAKYRCTVWNRALNQNQKLEAATMVIVNYYPRVSVGPKNPLRIEKDETARIECHVDSKPAVTSVKWIRNGRFIETNFVYTIPRVTLKDAGIFTCSADNGLGQPGKAELQLDVLHAPVVSLPTKREVKEGTNVEVECKYTANPRPSSVQWFKEGDSSFHQNGPVLRLNSITAHHNGRYTCSVTNYLQPSGKSKTMRVGNATIELNVEHPPGQAIITPDRPIAIDGRSVTLRCEANPPGYPQPQFRWWKEERGETKTLAIGSEFTIESARLSNAGRYSCEASNDLGNGKVGSVDLEVYQAPKIKTQLKPTMTKRAGDTGFQITCSAIGKPKPRVRWYKDGQEIIDNESEMYQINVDDQETIPTFNVVSTLKFVGPERIDSQHLMPSDKGHYTCQFENEVSRVETLMLLRVEHGPVVVHQHNKVAYDLNEVAYITCQMQALPKPTFDWSFGNSVLPNDRVFYEISTTALGDDIHQSTLRINTVQESAYGEYTCKAANLIGSKRTKIRLQPKGKPERPLNVRAISASYNVITLTWDEGFNGGFNDTRFTVEYEKVAGSSSEPKYKNCAFYNPCNVSGLEQHTEYRFRLKASNALGNSKYSHEAFATTKVDVAIIPKPGNVHYEKSTSTASFTVDDTLLELVAHVELENVDGTWSHYDGLQMEQSSFAEMPVTVPVSNLRVRLCLKSNELMCGPYTEALIVDVRPNARTSMALAEPWLIGLVVIAVLVALTAALVLVKCCCCAASGARKAKTLKSDSDGSGGSRPTIIHGTQPPPYTTTFGIENKAADGKDLSDDNLKADLYHAAAATAASSYPEQPNSNSNSANGGSVNSQDSLWNVKAGGHNDPAGFQAANGFANYLPYDAMMLQQQQQHPSNSSQTGQQQASFAGSGDYTHYPYPDEYINDRNRQYLVGTTSSATTAGDAYTNLARRSDSDYTHYGDINGLPQAFNLPEHLHHHHLVPNHQPGSSSSSTQQQQQQQQPVQQQQQQQTFDGSMDESGYSTPNSKNRRIIREIIV